MPIPDELLSAAKGSYASISVRLREVPYDWKVDGMTIDGKFFYLALRDGMPTIDEFIDFLYWQIIPFCIPRKERAEKLRLFLETNEDRYHQELSDRARNLFIKARQRAREKAISEGKDPDLASGEPGELILFVLLEAFRKAPQLACKMSLKTSENMPVHGSDSVHIGRGSSPGAVRVIWGESKLYVGLAQALDEICSSISSFLNDQEGRTGRDRDIDIVRDHMDVTDPDWRAALLNYFDPYSESSNLREEAFACFVGFTYSVYEQMMALPTQQREEFLRSKLLGRIRSACDLFANKIQESGLQHLRIDFFLIPFPDVQAFRAKFLRRIGGAV